MNANLIAGAALALALGASVQAAPPKKAVLVELFTSQGCDMCPAAEENLGKLSKEFGDKIVPIAFHVDYFDKPWRDPFSDKSHSQRQMAYNGIYKGEKHPEYGLYYTPMMMVAGKLHVNGRDPASQRAAVKQALAGPSLGDLTVKWASATSVTVRFEPARGTALPSKVLVAAVAVEDGVVTKVESGENSGKSLENRHGARKFLYKFVDVEKGKPIEADLAFPATLEGDPKGRKLAAFVQDPETGAVFQATLGPWSVAPAPRQ